MIGLQLAFNFKEFLLALHLVAFNQRLFSRCTALHCCITLTVECNDANCIITLVRTLDSTSRSQTGQMREATYARSVQAQNSRGIGSLLFLIDLGTSCKFSFSSFHLTGMFSTRQHFFCVHTRAKVHTLSGRHFGFAFALFSQFDY